MFSQGSKPEAEGQAGPSSAGRGSGEPSVISADLKIVGDLHCAGDVQIKGTVEGDIRSRSVTIGDGAHVQGAIHGDSVHVSGSVKGEIEAPTVTVAQSARIMGNIVHKSLAVEAGAHLEGQCVRMESRKAAEQAGADSKADSEAAEPSKRAAGGTGS